MKDLEFLPEHHIRARENQRLRFVRMWLLIAMTLSMVFWALHSRGDIVSVRRQLEGVLSRAEAIDSQQHERRLAGLTSQQRSYRDREALVARLSEEARRSDLLREIVQCLPEQVVLTRLEVDRQARKVPERFGAAAMGRGPGPGRPAETEVVDRVRVEGYAADDLPLARFLQNMSDGGVFERGELAFSKDATFRQRAVRVFAATFFVPLGRSRVAQVPPEEVLR